jgi:hypothetical protein
MTSSIYNLFEMLLTNTLNRATSLYTGRIPSVTEVLDQSSLDLRTFLLHSPGISYAN